MIYSDGELTEQELSLDTAQLLRDASPWGQGFPSPLFDGDFRVVSQRVVGKKHLKMTLQPAHGDARSTASHLTRPSCRRVASRSTWRTGLMPMNTVALSVPQLIVEHIETL